MKKSKKKWWIVGAVFLGLWLFIHLSPSRSLRWTVLLFGFPKESFSSEIVYSSIEGNHLTFYQLEPTTVGNTGPMLLWKTTQIGPFYFSWYYGSH